MKQNLQIQIKMDITNKKQFMINNIIFKMINSLTLSLETWLIRVTLSHYQTLYYYPFCDKVFDSL